MRNGVYLNPPYLSGALEAAQASQMFAALGGSNITASTSGAMLLPVNQSSGAQHQAFDPLNPPQNQPTSLILPSVPDKTIPEPPFHLESSQSHLRSFQMPESSGVILSLDIQHQTLLPFNIAYQLHRSFPNLYFSIQDDASEGDNGKTSTTFSSRESKFARFFGQIFFDLSRTTLLSHP
jgi:hypothetical protein